MGPRGAAARSALCPVGGGPRHCPPGGPPPARAGPGRARPRHIGAPAGTATAAEDVIHLNALKSMITSAGEADSYVWISRATQGEGNTLWLVDSPPPGLSLPGRFNGMGLRGNASSPLEAPDLGAPPPRPL